MNKAQLQYFTKQLVRWHAGDNDRSLPWKNEKDPYRIWLSEVILQQTRAQQGLPYYLRFIEAYPTIKKMAAAPDEEVFRLWQGLGYYNRCRNMLATARYIAHDLKGKFPATYDEISMLKGVGPYTAAAIASFAYGLPHAVVDGNVYRVLSRYIGIETATDTTAGKREFTELAGQLLDKTDSAGYNQAIMDLGATVCKPAAPLCTDCPLQKKCFAFEHGMIADLPVKNKKLAVKTRYFHYIFFTWKNKVWINKRTGKDIWQNLYEPLLVEHDGTLDEEDLTKHPELKRMKLKVGDLHFEGSFSQRLTHRIIESRFYVCPLKNEHPALPGGGEWVAFDRLHDFAFPKSLVFFIEKSYFY